VRRSGTAGIAHSTFVEIKRGNAMIRRIARSLLVALIVAGTVGWRPQLAAQSSLPPCGIAMRVLVVSQDGKEADLAAITTALEYIGTPYDVFISDPAINPNPLTLETPVCATSSLSETPARALYQSVILTNNWAAGGHSQTIVDYEKKFGIRQVTWFTYPTADYGFNAVTDSDISWWDAPATTAQLTLTGAGVFPYIRTGEGASPILVRYATVYHATPLEIPTDGSTTEPLLIDPNNKTLAAIHKYADGRQNLVMTFDSNPNLLHSMLLSYGVINWATNGLFIGERHTYISPQIDDLFIDDQQWLASTACGTSVDSSTLPSYRMTDEDLTTVSTWQTLKRQQALTPDLKITMAFNGLGTSSSYTYRIVGSNDTIIGGNESGSRPDLLTPAAAAQQANYFWASHTYNHENLDNISYTAAASEITLNNAVATQLGLDDYTLRFMVQPDVSGLRNANFLKAAYDNGIRYVVSNTSISGQGNPTPNTGYWNPVDPRIFVIPRRANNLFFNVATPADWVQEYNCLYGPNGSDPGFRFDHNLSYTEILDFISQELLAHLLRGELDPWMFHQPNLAKFTNPDGSVHTLLGDLLDRTFEKYGSYVRFPITSPSIETIGARMQDRTTIRTKGIDATIKPGVAIVFRSPQDVTVPVTGLANGAELYAGQSISWVPLSANVPVTVSFNAPYVSGKSDSADGAGTRAVSVTTAQPGDLLLAFVGAGGPSTAAQVATVTSAGLNWELVRRANGQPGTSEIWKATPTVPLSDLTVTSTLALPGYHQTLTVVPFAGSGGVGASAINSASTGAPSVSLVTTNRNSLVYGIGSDTKHAIARTLGSNQWMVHEFVNAAANDTFWIQALAMPVPNSGTPVLLNDTAPTRDPWNFAAVEIVLEPKSTTVPSVVNMTQGWAATTIGMAGLGVGSVKYEISSTVPAGLVISQSPEGGQTVAAGTTVDLVVSAPGPLVADVVSATAVGPLSMDVNATSGQLVVAFVSADGSQGLPQAMTVWGGDLLWTRAARANGQRGTAEVWKAIANGPLKVTSTPARNGYQQTMTVVTFNGAGIGGAVNANSAVNGAPTVSLTTTTPYSLVFGVGFDPQAAVARTPGPGQVMIYELVNSADRNDFWVQARSGYVTVPGTVVVNDTAPTGDRWNLAAVEIAVP
jgi:hypothetical protein